MKMLCHVLSAKRGNRFDGLFSLISAVQEALNVKWLPSGAGGSTPSAGGPLQREDKPPHNTDINQLYHNTPPVLSRTVSAEIVSTRHQKRDGNGGIRSFRTLEI